MQLLSAIQAPSAIKACSAIQACSGITGLPPQTSFTNTYSVLGDGVDDYVSSSFDANTEIGAGSLTISFFFKYVNATTGTQQCMYFGSYDSKHYVQINNGGTNGRMQVVFQKASGHVIAESSLTPSDNTWYHCIVTRSGTTANIWIDNANNGTITNAGVDSDISSDNANILRHRTNFAGLFMNGYVDEFAVWNIAFDSSQRSTLYNNGVPHNLNNVESSNLKLYYRFEEGSGTTVEDLSGNGYNGTLTNGPTFSTDIPVYRFNRYAVDFDGTDDYMSVPDSNDLSFGDGTTDSPFSISAWVKMGDATRFRVIAKSNTDIDGEYIFVVNGADNLFTYLMDGGNSNRIGAYTTSTVTAYEGLWTHIAMTYDGGGLWTGIKIYINGVSQTVGSDNAGSYTAMHNTNAVLSVGRLQWNSNSYADGLIDEVSIFASELSAANISTIYNSGEVGDISSLSPIAHWRMGDDDGATGTTITNQGSASGIDGTLTNGPTFSNDIPS